MKEEKKKPQKAAQKAAKAFTSRETRVSDPFGSYTGQPKDKHDVPVQDADDL